MEPVQPTPSPDITADITAAAPTAGTPDAQPSSGGRFSRVTGLASRALGLDQQAGSPAPAAPSFEPTPTPGLQPRVDTTPATVPSPWAQPDTAGAVTTTGTAAPDATTSLTSIAEPTLTGTTSATVEPTPAAPAAAAEPVITPTPEPIPAPIPEPTSEPVVGDQAVAAPTPEPGADLTAAQPEPTPAVSPVWEPSPTPAGGDTDLAGTGSPIEPDMRPSSAPSVEPTTTNDAGDADANAETTEEPPLFKKVVEGDLIRYEFTPEGREKIKGAFTRAIDSGAFDDLAGIFATGQGAEPKAEITPSPAPATETQPTALSADSLTQTNDTVTQPEWSNPGQPITRGPV